MSDSVTLWTVACQAPLSTGSSRQEYWSVLPCPSPRDLPNPGIERVSLMFLALTGGFFTTDITWEAYSIGSTNSLIFTLYGMARQSIISSVLDISHYNAWSKKEVWHLDIHPMFPQQHLREHLYDSPTTGLTSPCVLCNTSFVWPRGNM